jgi:hypothetical protein
MSPQPDEALDVLRAVWSAQGQTSADLAESFGTKKSCKNMKNVGFGDMGEDQEDLRTAWRERLEREGKRTAETRSIRDLVLGSEQAH